MHLLWHAADVLRRQHSESVFDALHRPLGEADLTDHSIPRIEELNAMIAGPDWEELDSALLKHEDLGHPAVVSAGDRLWNRLGHVPRPESAPSGGEWWEVVPS